MTWLKISVCASGDQVADIRTSSIVNRPWNKKGTSNGKTRIEKFSYENKDDEKNNDAGNRGIIEVKGKAAPKKY